MLLLIAILVGIKCWVGLRERFALRRRSDCRYAFNLLVRHHLVVINLELAAVVAVIVLILDYRVGAAPVRIDVTGELAGLGLVSLVAFAIAKEEHAAADNVAG